MLIFELVLSKTPIVRIKNVQFDFECENVTDNFVGYELFWTKDILFFFLSDIESSQYYVLSCTKWRKTKLWSSRKSLMNTIR